MQLCKEIARLDLSRARCLIKEFIRLNVQLAECEDEESEECFSEQISQIEREEHFPVAVHQVTYVQTSSGEKVSRPNCWLHLARMEAKRRSNRL